MVLSLVGWVWRKLLPCNVFWKGKEMILFFLSIIVIGLFIYYINKKNKWYDIACGYSKYNSYYGPQWITLQARKNGELRTCQDDLFCDKAIQKWQKGFFILDHENLLQVDVSKESIKRRLLHHASHIHGINN